MECEICGAAEAEYLIAVEGAKLSVCQECSSSGKLLRGPMPREHKQSPGASIPSSRQELEVVEGFGSIIAAARKRLGLPIEVLSERINEKLSFLERVEHERTLPDEKLCRKLEKELGIKLRAEVAETSTAPIGSSKGGMTLGDILQIEINKKKKKDA